MDYSLLVGLHIPSRYSLGRDIKEDEEGSDAEHPLKLDDLRGPLKMDEDRVQVCDTALAVAAALAGRPVVAAGSCAAAVGTAAVRRSRSAPIRTMRAVDNRPVSQRVRLRASEALRGGTAAAEARRDGNRRGLPRGFP